MDYRIVAVILPILLALSWASYNIGRAALGQLQLALSDFKKNTGDWWKSISQSSSASWVSRCSLYSPAAVSSCSDGTVATSKWVDAVKASWWRRAGSALSMDAPHQMGRLSCTRFWHWCWRWLTCMCGSCLESRRVVGWRKRFSPGNSAAASMWSALSTVDDWASSVISALTALIQIKSAAISPCVRPCSSLYPVLLIAVCPPSPVTTRASVWAPGLVIVKTEEPKLYIP